MGTTLFVFCVFRVVRARHDVSIHYTLMYLLSQCPRARHCPDKKTNQMDFAQLIHQHLKVDVVVLSPSGTTLDEIHMNLYFNL